MENTEDLFTAEQVATMLGVATETLKNWRQEKRGPAYVRLGHRTLRYRRGSVQAWLQLKESLSAAGANPLQIPLPDAP